MTSDVKNLAKNLHPLEIRILLSYKKGDELTIEKVEKELGFKQGNGNQALSWLAAKGLITELRRETAVFFELTALGEEWREKGSPEERMLDLVRRRVKAQGGPEASPLQMKDCAEVLGMAEKDVGGAFGKLSKAGVLKMDGDKNIIPGLPPQAFDDPENPAFSQFSIMKHLMEKTVAAGGLIALSALNEEERDFMAGRSKKRGAADAPYRELDRVTVVYGFAPDAERLADCLRDEGITGEETGALTVEMLESGSWKGKKFRSYNVQTPPTRLTVGRTNPYAQFLENVKDKLASLGFEEFDGSLVETEFWNSDALFMPQFHSARDIHDAYRIAEPEMAREIEEPWLSNVAAAHENGGNTGSTGWNYAFDRDFTRRLILRSHGTVLSARTLPAAKIPGKYFGIVRCFRYDRVDATHLPDFYQTEGIVLGEDVNLCTLLGMLEMFALEVAGAKEVKYVPGYFPFTEPSVEVHVKHPVLGWFELGGSGIFRPELTESLGVHVPVAAWGIGIDRMALMALGLNDLRNLFSSDIESVRLRRSKSD
ncbi:MAG: phenylalanine--tRNA ligase subunit alpha [Spirochaetes bacterium]|nr:phenylalanine--tRNA ligase subunit alpha [Spirochaetota bacterium]